MWTWNLPDYSNTLVIAITGNPLDQAVYWHEEQSKDRFKKKLLLQEYCSSECDYWAKRKCCHEIFCDYRLQLYLKNANRHFI